MTLGLIFEHSLYRTRIEDEQKIEDEQEIGGEQKIGGERKIEYEQNIEDVQKREAEQKIKNEEKMEDGQVYRHIMCRSKVAPELNSKLVNLDLSGCRLTLLSQFLPRNLRSLKVTNNQLTQLPDNMACLSQLEFLDISSNQLTSFSIGHLPKLAWLDASHNKLTEFPPHISNLPRLSMLDLSHNLMISLPSSLVSSSCLRRLDLSWNLLEGVQLPTWLGRMRVCSSLVLTGNPLGWRFQTCKLGGNKRLTILELGNLALTELPEDVTSLRDLQHLSLSNVHCNSLNSLMLIPSSISCLQSIVTLELAGIGLVELPSAIGQLNNLEVLDISRNHIAFLPASFSRLTSLKVFDASNNELLMLPPNLENLVCLEKLLVPGNKLGDLPPLLPKLATLDYYDNQVCSVCPRLLGMETLVMCDMASNMVSLELLEQMVGRKLEVRYKKMQEELRMWLGEEKCRGRKELSLQLPAGGEVRDGVTSEDFSWPNFDTDEHILKDDVNMNHLGEDVVVEDWDELGIWEAPCKKQQTSDPLHKIGQVWFTPGLDQFCPADLHVTPVVESLRRKLVVGDFLLCWL